MAAKRLRITQIEAWSWQGRGLTFFGAFGFIWLFLEPLFALLGGSGPLSSLGVWRYLVLVLFAVAITVAAELIHKNQTLGRMRLVPFTIILAVSGTRYDVEAPEDMRTSVFVRLFLEKASNNAPPRSFLSRFDIYRVSLVVKTGKGSWIPTQAIRSLKENNIQAKDECRIQGIIQDEFAAMDIMIDKEVLDFLKEEKPPSENS